VPFVQADRNAFSRQFLNLAEVKPSARNRRVASFLYGSANDALKQPSFSRLGYPVLKLPIFAQFPAGSQQAQTTSFSIAATVFFGWNVPNLPKISRRNSALSAI